MSRSLADAVSAESVRAIRGREATARRGRQRAACNVNEMAASEMPGTGHSCWPAMGSPQGRRASGRGAGDRLP
jgi:hypothetical protein